EISRARLRSTFSIRRRRRALLGFPLHLVSAVPSGPVLERAQSDDLEKLSAALAVRKGRLGAAKYRGHGDGHGNGHRVAVVPRFDRRRPQQILWPKAPRPARLRAARDSGNRHGHRLLLALSQIGLSPD